MRFFLMRLKNESRHLIGIPPPINILQKSFTGISSSSASHLDNSSEDVSEIGKVNSKRQKDGS